MENKKKITIDYIPGLGDYLDSLNLEWVSDSKNNKATIFYDIPESLFMLGLGLGKYKQQYDI